jgi:uncharacterized PurR-regulated membrane protein YhhQ (DUF165 family)
MHSLALIAAYVATIPAANWMIGHVGICIPDGPCLIPVLPGVSAPSGVLAIGAALLLRDLVQRQFGIGVGLACIGVGTVVSLAVASPSLAIASGSAFLLSELVDFAAYTPLARRHFYLALVVSCAAGAVADSALFLWLAFGNLDHLAGQVIGKVYAVVAYSAVGPLVRPAEHEGG